MPSFYQEAYISLRSSKDDTVSILTLCLCIYESNSLLFTSTIDKSSTFFQFSDGVELVGEVLVRLAKSHATSFCKNCHNSLLVIHSQKESWRIRWVHTWLGFEKQSRICGFMVAAFSEEFHSLMMLNAFPNLLLLYLLILWNSE